MCVCDVSYITACVEPTEVREPRRCEDVGLRKKRSNAPAHRKWCHNSVVRWCGDGDEPFHHDATCTAAVVITSAWSSPKR